MNMIKNIYYMIYSKIYLEFSNICWSRNKMKKNDSNHVILIYLDKNTKMNQVTSRYVI